MADQQNILLAREKVYKDQLLDLKIKKLDLDGHNQNKYDDIITEVRTKLDQLNVQIQSSEAKTVSEAKTNDAYIISMKISNLSTHFKSISKFLPGSNCEIWIDELDRLYAVHIKPELNDYPTPEV